MNNNNNEATRPVIGYPVNPNGYSTSTGHPYTTGTTAHPYTTRPPPNAAYYAPNPYHHGADPYADQCCAFCRVFCILIGFVFLLIIITGFVLLYIWYIHEPRVPEFRVDSVTVSNLNLSSTLISGNWDVQFSVRNPNKKSTVLYDHIDASVLYKSDSLSSTTMTPFSQGTKNHTVRATFAAVSSYVDSSVVSEINGDRSRGSVKFNVRLLARASFKGGALGFCRPYITVLCGDLPVGIPLLAGRGSLIGGSRECSVDFGRYNR